MTSNDLAKISKDYFLKSSITAASAVVLASFPFLNVPPINLIVNKAISWLMNQVADKLELLSFFLYIDLRTDQEGMDYVKAAHEANILQTEEAMAKADAAFKRFAKFTN